MGDASPESPEQCLRTRYSGFAYRLPEYIIRTTDRTNSDWMSDKVKWAKKLNKESMFDSFEFQGLEVGALEDGQDEQEQFLSMKVKLMPVDDKTGLPKQPEPMVFAERSKFVCKKDGSTWLYAAGEVRTEAAGFKDRILNGVSDLDAMRTDVEYVEKLIKNKGRLPEGEAVPEGMPELPKMPEMPKMPWDKTQ